MKTSFIISPFSDVDCDTVFDKVYAPISSSVGLTAIRLDKNNNGSLVMNQIINNINDSEIIIADLTLARPNCYFEIGYAMGAKKEARIFLTCREDHSSGSTKYNPDGHKIHFDLAGYDITFWDVNDLGKFYKQLEDKIKGRMSTWSAKVPMESPKSERPMDYKFDEIIKSVNKDK